MRLRLTVFILLFIWLECQVLAHVTPTQTLAQLEIDLEKDPENTSLLLDKAHLLQLEKRLDESEEILIQVAELESPPSSDAVYLWVSLGMRKELFEDALKMSDGGIEAYPENFFQWQIRGQLFMQMERVDDSVEAFKESLKYDMSGSQRGYVFIARILLGRDEPGDKEHAVSLLNQAIEKLGNLSELHHMCSRLEMELGRYDAALGHIDALIERFGERVTFSMKRAEYLEKAGRYELAIEEYESVLSMLDVSEESKYGKNRVIERKAHIEASISRLKDNLTVIR
ncbi:MAG: tetratricopeptide repeat protein [Opitutales bacterium]